MHDTAGGSRGIRHGTARPTLKIMTISEFKSQTVKLLAKTSPSPQLDVEVLLEHFTGLTKTLQLLNNHSQIENDKIDDLNDAVKKRMSGLPVAYITGNKEFFGYDFFVTPDVLIPKPDTEILVEYAVDMILAKIDAQKNRILTICDMCAGSGCIGLSVIKTLNEEYDIPPQKIPQVTFVDISRNALEIAEKNAQALLNKELQARIKFIRSNLFEFVPYHFDFILTNPPYIPHTMVDQLLQDGRNEPRLALDGDVSIDGDRAQNPDGEFLDDGLSLPKNLIEQSLDHLAPRGKIIMECGEYNCEKAACFARLNGYKTELYRDLEGQFRGFIGHL